MNPLPKRLKTRLFQIHQNLAKHLDQTIKTSDDKSIMK